MLFYSYCFLLPLHLWASLNHVRHSLKPGDIAAEKLIQSVIAGNITRKRYAAQEKQNPVNHASYYHLKGVNIAGTTNQKVN
jgi:hypothetical protein